LSQFTKGNWTELIEFNEKTFGALRFKTYNLDMTNGFISLFIILLAAHNSCLPHIEMYMGICSACFIHVLKPVSSVNIYRKYIFSTVVLKTIDQNSLN